MILAVTEIVCLKRKEQTNKQTLSNSFGGGGGTTQSRTTRSFSNVIFRNILTKRQLSHGKDLAYNDLYDF